MEQKAALQYIFDEQANRWIPNPTVTPSGGAAVTIVGPNGVAADTGGMVSSIDPNSDNGQGLNVKAQVFLFDPGSNLSVVGRNTDNNTDAVATQTTGVFPSSSYTYGFNGATWDRIRSFGNNADNVATLTVGVQVVAAYQYAFDGATWDRLRSGANNADTVATLALGVRESNAYGYLFNGATFDRAREASATNVAALTGLGAQLSAAPGEWAINHTPAVNTVATITRAAGAAGVRHVCRSITATLIGLAAAAETTVLVNLRDGATGAGTILWSTRLLVTGTVGSQVGVSITGLNIPGTAATAMTLEFAAAGGASTFETVALTGYDVS